MSCRQNFAFKRHTSASLLLFLFSLGTRLYSTQERFISVCKFLLIQCKKIKILQNLAKMYFEFIFQYYAYLYSYVMPQAIRDKVKNRNIFKVVSESVRFLMV